MLLLGRSTRVISLVELHRKRVANGESISVLVAYGHLPKEELI